MKHKNEEWTTFDLELFHDEELDDALHDKLSKALRRDEQLRAKLITVHQLDESLREALIRPRPLATRTAWRQPVFAVAAASLIVLFSVVVWYEGRATPEPLAVGHKQSTEVDYRPIRVVFSLPIPGGGHASPPGLQPRITESRISGATQDDGPAFLNRLDRALASQDIQAALDLVLSAQPEQQRMAYARLGEMLRSAQVAEMILDSLGAPEQLAACGAWAHEPHLRPIVFARLQHLSVDVTMAEKLRMLVADFSHDPELRAWLRAYQFDNRT